MPKKKKKNKYINKISEIFIVLKLIRWSITFLAIFLEQYFFFRFLKLKMYMTPYKNNYPFVYSFINKNNVETNQDNIKFLNYTQEKKVNTFRNNIIYLLSKYNHPENIPVIYVVTLLFLIVSGRIFCG